VDFSTSVVLFAQSSTTRACGDFGITSITKTGNDRLQVMVDAGPQNTTRYACAGEEHKFFDIVQVFVADPSSVVVDFQDDPQSFT
jgi:hypothetical protein